MENRNIPGAKLSPLGKKIDKHLIMSPLFTIRILIDLNKNCCVESYNACKSGHNNIKQTTVTCMYCYNSFGNTITVR